MLSARSSSANSCLVHARSSSFITRIVVRFFSNSIGSYQLESTLYLQGMVTFKDADLQEKVKKELHSTADHIAFLSIAKLEDSVREDVDFLKNSPLLVKDVPVSGWLYDVKTGKLNRIV